MKKTLLCAIAAAALSSAAVQANPFNYTYAEGGLVHENNEAIDAAGFTVGGSYALTPNIFAAGSYSELEDNDSSGAGGDKLHREVAEVGFGVNYPLSRTVDMVATAKHIEGNADIDATQTSYSGNTLTFGIRSQMPYGKNGELTLGVKKGYADGEGATGVYAGLRTDVAERYSVGVQYEALEDSGTASITVRRHF
jgi:predicted porin